MKIIVIKDSDFFLYALQRILTILQFKAKMRTAGGLSDSHKNTSNFVNDRA